MSLSLKIIIVVLYSIALPFYHFGIFFGYDSPIIYADALLILYVLFNFHYYRQKFFLFNGIKFFAFFFFSYIILELYVYFFQNNVNTEKILTQGLRFLFTFISFLSLILVIDNKLVKIFEGGELYIATFVSLIGIIQILSYYFNLCEYFFLLPNNPTYITPGAADATYGSFVVKRITSIYPEPFWMCFYLIGPLIKTFLNRRYFFFFVLSIPYVFSLSIAAYFALLFFVIYYIVKRYPKNKKIFFTAILIIFIMFLMIEDTVIGERLFNMLIGSDPSQIHRIATINEAIDLFLNNPVLGIGAGNYNAKFETDLSINSLYFLFLAETGIIVFISFLFFLAKYLFAKKNYFLNKDFFKYNSIFIVYLFFFINANDIYNGIFTTQFALYIYIYESTKRSMVVS